MSTKRDLGYRGILFDLDGTLVDTLDLILASFRHTMSSHLGHAPPDHRWLETLGRPLRIQLQSFARSEEELELMFDTYLAHNQEHHQALVRPYPGMRDALRTLDEQGYRLAVVTSKIRPNTQRELASVELDDFFQVVITADDVESPKPHPAPVLMAVSQLGLTPDEALLIGDSVFDLRAGRAAGVDTAAALWGPFDYEQLANEKPDFWLERISSLLKLLGVNVSDRGA